MKLSKSRLKLPKLNVSRFKNRITPKPKFSSTTDKDQISLSESLRSPEIRKKILITVGLVVVYRILAAVPLPGIDTQLFAEAFGNNPLTNFFSIVTGGRLDNPSVVAIGLGAYINASIVLQLLTSIIPKLEELSKEGERGRTVINQYTRILAVPLTVVQAVVIYSVLKSVTATVPQLAGLLDNVTNFDIVTMVVSLTAGSMVLMWLGELITAHGIGNGISIIITISILTVVPNLVARDFVFLSNDIELLKNGNFNVLINDNFKLIYFFIAGFYLLIMSIVYINEAVRKVTIQYARRFRAAGVQATYLPLKLNQAGVMPVIFASALLSFPQIIAQLLIGTADSESRLYSIGTKINESFLGNNSAFLNSGDFMRD
ncbi:MAG TPA: preprotein translocase subunit SecY, partial [Candidatus Dojkabacteria bacterium]|nr:preprotein translocase subunit SecY [Candidatus Dojkabacteria bacterium]